MKRVQRFKVQNWNQAVIKWLLLITNQIATDRVGEAFLSQVLRQQVRKRVAFKCPLSTVARDTGEAGHRT